MCPCDESGTNAACEAVDVLRPHGLVFSARAGHLVSLVGDDSALVINLVTLLNSRIEVTCSW